MIGRPDDDGLVSVALSVSDGAPLDWALLEESEAGAADLALVRELQVIARIAEGHRRVAHDDSARAKPSVERRWGHLVIKDELGAGSFGVVYRAHDPRLERDVALKIYQTAARPHGGLTSLFAEGRLLARVRHQNVVVVHGLEQHGDEIGLWLELVDGRTLATEVRNGGPLGCREAALVGQDVCRALAAVHQAGLIHRDVKPQNVVRERGGRIVLMDFGLGRDLHAPAPPGTDHGGTPLYMAPELFAGAGPSIASDIYSVGVLLFFLVTGSYPVLAATRAELEQAHREGRRRLVRDVRADLPDAFMDVIERACAREPALRYPTMGAMQNALTRSIGVSSDPSTTTIRELREWVRGIVTDPPPPASAPRPLPRSRPMRLAVLTMVALIGTGALVRSLVVPRSAAVAPAKRPPVVAVMPLTNASGDSSKDYLALGVADNLTMRLAGLSSITVLSRSAVAEARGKTHEVPALAAQLDAMYLVDGSVQQAGDRIRVNLSLVRPDGSIAWADAVEGPFDSILSLQTRLASALAHAVAVQLTAADRVSLAEQATASPEALAAFWRGKALLERRDIKGNLEAALASYDEAIALDPRFAEAYAARGEALWIRYSDARSPADAQAAIDANNAAVKLKPNGPAVRHALAITLAGTGKLDAAIEELQHALALRPNFEDARIQLGRVLARQGKTEEAIAEFTRVSDQRPNSAAPFSAMGTSLYEAGRYREAAAAFERVTVLQPDNVIAYQQLGVAYQSMGENDRALGFYQKSLAIRPYPQAYSNIGAIHHQRGDYANAIQAYRQAMSLRPNARETHRNLGDALTRLGRHREAMAAYRRASQLAESDLEVNPNDPRIVASLAVYLQKAGEADRARDRIAQAVSLSPKDFEVLRRAAQVHALAGRRDAALDALDRAIQNGLRRETAAFEDEFQSLRELPRFKALIQPGQR